MLLVMGCSFWLSAASVKYRDLRHVIPFFIQILIYCSPVAYTTGMIPSKWLIAYAFNPMVGIIDGFRWALLGRAPNLYITLPISLIVTGIIFISGVPYFYKTEKNLSDFI